LSYCQTNVPKLLVCIYPKLPLKDHLLQIDSKMMIAGCSLLGFGLTHECSKIEKDYSLKKRLTE